MQDLHESWIALKLGGVMIFPLSLLAVLALAIMLEKAVLYWRYARLSERAARPGGNLWFRLGKHWNSN